MATETGRIRFLHVRDFKGYPIQCSSQTHEKAPSNGLSRFVCMCVCVLARGSMYQNNKRGHELEKKWEKTQKLEIM